MSIKRIESAYAHFMDKKMSGTQMAVLQALAYCANENDREKCYPSYSTLSKMTHLSDETVGSACKALRDMQAISWKSGGHFNGTNRANFYTFLFPLVKMTKSRERYESVGQSVDGGALAVGEGYPSRYPPVPQQTPPGTQAGTPRVPQQIPPGTQADTPRVPKQLGSNTEYNTQSNSESKSESKAPPQPFPDFDFKRVLKKVNTNGETDPRLANESIDELFHHREHSSPIQAAMRVCGVSDTDNMSTFTKYAKQFIEKNNLNLMWETVEKFWGEIKHGEHDEAKNKAAILTSRFKKAL